MRYLLLLPILLPFAAAFLLALRPLRADGPRRRFVVAALALELGFATLCACTETGTLPVLPLGEDLYVTFALDGLGRVFLLLVAFMWLLSGLFAQEYMAHEDDLGRYYVFLFLSEGALAALCCAANYLTLYLGFELMTLFSLPLALHTQTEAARRGGFRYLFYSVFGACLGLLGFYTVHTFGSTAAFAPGDTVTGVVRSVRDYGIFIELAPNLSGLADWRGDLAPGDRVSVYIKSIRPEGRKIKLQVVEKLGPAGTPGDLHYFITDGVVRDWSY